MLCDWRAISGAIEPFRSKIYFSTRAVISLSSPPQFFTQNVFCSVWSCLYNFSLFSSSSCYLSSFSKHFLLLVHICTSHSRLFIPLWFRRSLLPACWTCEGHFSVGDRGEGMIQLQFFATAALGECKRTAGWMDDKRRKVKTKKRKRQTVFNPTFVCILMRTQWAGVCVLASHD